MVASSQRTLGHSKRFIPLRGLGAYNGIVDASQVQQIVEGLKLQLRGLGVRRLFLVGSAALGEIGPESDLDFVVEFEGPATFLGYMGLIEALEAELGRHVDLTTLDALRPELKIEVMTGARQVA